MNTAKSTPKHTTRSYLREHQHFNLLCLLPFAAGIHGQCAIDQGIECLPIDFPEIMTNFV